VPLAVDRVGEPGAPRAIAFLHGILGSGSNLRTVARRFVAARPGWQAWLVDLRGHGRSPKGSAGASLEAAAGDVLGSVSVRLTAIAGHSFGGKVALELARQAEQAWSLEHAVVIDSPPGVRRESGPGSAVAVVEVLGRLPAEHASRETFRGALVGAGLPGPIADWLGQSLERLPGGAVRFGLDLGEIRALLESYFAADLWPIVERPPGRVAIHLVVGDRSPAWSPEERERARELALRSPRVTLDVLPAGHWVHVDDPEGLLAVLLARLP